MDSTLSVNKNTSMDFLIGFFPDILCNRAKKDKNGYTG